MATPGELLDAKIQREMKLAYQRGYAAGANRRWNAHRPPLPPHELVAAVIAAATGLRDAVDGQMAMLEPGDNFLEESCGAHMDALDESLRKITAWLTGGVHEPPAAPTEEPTA